MKENSVLITGGNKGLGPEAARRFGEQDWTIFLDSRDEARGQAAADNPRVVMVSSAGGSFAVVTDPAESVSKMHELAHSSSKAALHMITVRCAQALPKITFNALTPGEDANHKFTATDMNNHAGQLTVTEASDPIVELATLDADRPAGTFIDRLGPVAW